MDRLLDNLMLHGNNIVNKDLYQLPDILDMTSDNPIINFDQGKKESYLFYVESPFQEQIGYYDDLKVFVVKASPYVVKYDKQIGERYNRLNSVDGDTMHFILDSLIDTNTAFNVGEKEYSSLGAFMDANNQERLTVRLLGVDCPEIIKYMEVPIKKNVIDKYVITEKFEIATNNTDVYIFDSQEYEKETLLTFLKLDTTFNQIIGEPYEDDNTLIYTVVGGNDTLEKSDAYRQAGLDCKDMLIDLLTRATDIRLVLDHQSLNRKPSDYSTPYDTLETLTHEGVFTRTFAFIDALWTEYTSHIKYPYRGYNAPGLDTYGRSLGEIYVKIYVEELKTETWVNAAKYILYHYNEFVKAVPSYTSNPTENYHNNFISPVFKLSTYDMRYKDIIDGFTHATSELIDERNAWYSQITGLDVDYIRTYSAIIGDTVLSVPPINIRSVTETNHTKIPLLRSKGAIVKSLPRSQKIIEIDLYFNNEAGINGVPYAFTGKNGITTTYYMNGLRSLIAQFKLTPFLPIENEYINRSLMVDAVTLVNLNVQTMPNYPKCLKATLTLAEFNYSVFMPELPESDLHNTFAQTIHYPAMRWYYQKLLQSGEAIKYLDFNSEAYITKAYGSRTALVPMAFRGSRVQFYIPDRSQLARRLELMIDPSPVLTQEQLTEEMLIGAKKLKPILENITQMPLDGAFVKSLENLIATHTFDAFSYVYATRDTTSEQVRLTEDIPLFTFVKEGESRLIAGDALDIIFKTYMQKEGQDLFVPQHIEPADRGTIWTLTQKLFDAISTGLQRLLGVYGETQSYARCDGNYLYIGAIVPLPSELVQSSYELRVIVQKAMSTLGLTEEEANEVLQYTDSSAVGTSIEIKLPVTLSRVSQTNAEPLYEIDVNHSANGLASRFFELNTDGVGFKVMNYLYAISSTEIDSALGDAVEQDAIDEKRDIVENSAMGLAFNLYDTGDLIVEQIGISYSNTFSSMALNMIEGKAFQYCGAQDITMQLSLVTQSSHTVQALTSLPEISADYAREFRSVLNCWPLRIDSELTRLFGVMEVIIENVQTETIPNQPGYTRLTLSLSSVDRTVRHREAMSRIDTELTNQGYIDYGNRGSLEVKTYFDLKHSLARSEVYPDLELPTVDELHDAGFELYRNKNYDINSAERTYVDPDFYFIYGHALACEIFRDNFLNAFETDISYDLTDKEGAYAKYLRIKRDDSFEERHELMNSLAQSQQVFYNDLSSVTMHYNYKDMSNEVYKSLEDVDKNKFKLGQTLAELGTASWHIGADVKLPFAESIIDAMPDVIEEQYTQKKKEIIDAIDAFLAVPIEENLPNHYDKTVNPNTEPDKQRSAFHAICEDVIREVTLAPVFNTMAMLSNFENSEFTTRNESLESTYRTVIANIVSAYADAYVAEGYYTNQFNNPELNMAANWQAKQYLVSDEERLVPHARVESNDSYYASSLNEALIKGVSFGPFNIALRDGMTLTRIHSDKPLNSDRRYFIDPYYLNLQLEGDVSAIQKHKERLMLLTGYGATAFVREILVLYKYYLEKGVLLSLYEIAREEAMSVYDGDLKTWSGEYVDSGSEKDIKEAQDIIINDYVMVLKSLSFSNLSNSEREALIIALDIKEDTVIHTALTDFSGSLFDVFDTIKNDRVKSLETLEEHFEALYQESLLEGDSASEKQARYYYLMEVCRNHENVDVAQFTQELEEMLYIFSEDNTFSQTHTEIATEQIFEDQHSIFAGRFVAMAMALIEPQTIMPLLDKKNAESLNMLVTHASRPDITHEYSRLRKFLYALEGRDVLSLSTIGTVPISIESEYRNYITEKILIERSNQPELYLRDSFYDMIKHDKRGRMLRAFPTYYMFFIDEGREIGLWKLHDNFYSSTAIAEIEITKSRKIAADTAHIVLSNLFNSYTQDDKDFIYDLDNPFYEKSLRYKIQDAFNGLFSPRTYFNQASLERQNTPEPLTARLTPGTRMHIRMGYGANASELPIVFNGQIAEISNGSVCQIVAQGDGVELLNPIQDIQDSSDIQFQDSFTLKRFFEKWLTNGATPKTILGSILTSRGYWSDKMKEDLSNGYLRAVNPYGITHFGDPLFDAIFQGSECIQNLFEVHSSAPYTLTEEQAQNYVGLEKNYKTAEVPIIAIDVLGKTTWDIGHICASVAPDYKFAVVPFELRSSLFMGKGRDYYAYEYAKQEGIEANNSFIVEKRKPFEQYHYYTSYSDIIANHIVASNAHVKTNAIGLYQQTGSFGKVKPKETSRLYVDYSIYPEFQKSTTVDTQLWAQGMPILGNGFLLGINADTDSDVDDWVPGAAEIAWRMTASALKQSMKEMYQGELIVIGDPSVKPHDRMLITDLYEHMQGPAWVESIVHSFNAQTGFTTSIYADCVNEIDDRLEQQNDFLTKGALSKAAAAYLTPVALNQLVFRKNMKRINESIMQIILKGGLTLEANKTKITNLLYALNIKVDSSKINMLQEAIKAANIFDSFHLDNLTNAGKAVHLGFKENQKLKEIIANTTKAFFAGDGEALNSTLLDPFDLLDQKLTPSKVIQSVKDIGRLFAQNGSDLNKASGAYLENALKAASNDISVEQLEKLSEQAGVYDALISKGISETYVFNDTFIDELDQLADFILKSDMPENVKDYAYVLRNLKADNVIRDGKALSELGEAILKCSEVCTDTALLKRITGAYTDIKDFSKITYYTSKVRDYISHIDNLIAVAGAATGPIGIAASILYTAIEMGISYTIGAYATENLNRYLQNLQVMRIYPLTKNGRVMTAGITGHKGLVVGSPTEGDQDAWTEFITGLFGAKEPSNIVTSAIHFLFISDKTRQIAAKHRTYNNVPDVLESSYDFAELQAQFDANFNTRIARLAIENPLLNLNIERYDDMLEASQYFHLYAAKSYKDSIEIDKTTQQDFIPIISHAPVAAYIQQGVLVCLHDLLREKEITLTFNDDSKEMWAFSEGDYLFNLPILRQETLLILNMLVDKYVVTAELNMPVMDLEERIRDNQLQLTSATIVNSEGYEGTGFVFRITSQNTKALELTCHDLVREMNRVHTILNYTKYGNDHILSLGIPKNNE